MTIISIMANMDDPLYGYGYDNGVWIIPGSWYSDPYALYSDFTTDRTVQPDPLYIYNDGGQDLYLFYNAVLRDNSDITPVPEPSCLVFLSCAIVICWLRIFLKKPY
jgi:hypothetical protein